MPLSRFLRRGVAASMLAALPFAAMTFATASHAADAPMAMAMPMAAATPDTAEPAARLMLDEPLAGALANGALVLSFHTEHLVMTSLSAPPAAPGAPRAGHLHVALDHSAWQWVKTSSDPIVLFGLAPGPHTLLVDLADVNHKVLESHSVTFTVPKA